MTDYTQRAVDEPPVNTKWCPECGQHAALTAKSTRCPICDPDSYAGYRMDKFHTPTRRSELPPATYTSCNASWRPPSEETLCNRNVTATTEIRDSDTTPTDVNAAPTGMRYPVADSTTHTTLLSIARRWMSL